MKNLFYFVGLDRLMVMIVMVGATILKRVPNSKAWPSNP
jgi:hypothetical protein